MISLYFRINRGKYLIRMVVEEHKVIPAVIALNAFAIYDHDKEAWSKFAPDFPDSTTPDSLCGIGHTFFHMSGLVWHIASDNRFTRTFRALCAQIIVVNARLQLIGRELAVLENYVRGGCYPGQFVPPEYVIDADHVAYNFYPL